MMEVLTVDINKMIFILVLLFATVSGHNYHDFNNFDYSHTKMDSLQVPNFVSKNQTFSAKIGSNITFPCKVDRRGGGPYAMIFMYLSPDGQDRILYAGGAQMGYFPRVEKVKWDFFLQNIEKSDAGKYICRFETQPVLQLVHKLDVQYPAMIRRQGPPTQKVLKWTKVALKCEAYGHPTPTVTWIRKEGPPVKKLFTSQGNGLIFEHVERTDEGTYQCTASNGIGGVATDSIRLLVEYKPEITPKQLFHYTENSTEAKLTCIVYGRPRPNVSWMRGEALVSSQKHIMTHDGQHTHTLKIIDVTEQDFGKYTCRARNKHGITKETLEVTGLPRKPAIISSKEGQFDEMYVLIWETSSFERIVQYRIRHRKVSLSNVHPESTYPIEMQIDDGESYPTSYDMNQPKTYPVSYHLKLNPGNPWSDVLHLAKEHSVDPYFRALDSTKVRMRHVIENLEPSEDYEVTVRVENRYGWSEESDVFKFYTKRRVSLGLSTSEADVTRSSVILYTLSIITLFFR